jgi:hypothetical protein
LGQFRFPTFSLLRLFPMTPYAALLVLAALANPLALRLPFLGWDSLRSSVAQQALPETLEAIAAPQVLRQELAQRIPADRLGEAGTQIRLNGRLISAPWTTIAGRLAIAESAVVQGLGVELLSTPDYNRQPVRWFSEEETHPVLTTVFSSQSRFLDVTDLLDTKGTWQTQGGVLQISTPSAQILNLRQSSQPSGDRIVVDLDQATPWQILENHTELVVAIDATWQNPPPISLQSSSRVTAIRTQSSGAQTLIRIAKPTTLHTQVWTLPNPNRIVIDLQPSPTREFSIHWIPGLWWHQRRVSVSNTQIPVMVLEVDVADPALELRPIWNDPATLVGTSPLITMTQRSQAIASINGGFFNRDNQLPLGAVRTRNEWISGPILNRGAIAWNGLGEFMLGRLSLQDTVTTGNGTVIPLTHLNSGYVQAGVARYTPHWGSTYTPLTDNETVVTVQGSQVTLQERVEKAGERSVSIPPGGYLLVIRAHSAMVTALAIGTPLTLNTAVIPEAFAAYSEILGAGPLLIQNRQVVLNAEAEQFSQAFIQQRAARSAIGITPEGRLLLVTAQSQADGTGLTLTHIAQVMQALGATDALNLDGGSSTTLTLGGQVVNRPSASTARVSNGLGLFFNPDIP